MTTQMTVLYPSPFKPRLDAWVKAAAERYEADFVGSGIDAENRDLVFNFPGPVLPILVQTIESAGCSVQLHSFDQSTLNSLLEDHDAGN